VGSAFLHAATLKTYARRVLSAQSASLVIAPQLQITCTHTILADDDAYYDERGFSACHSPFFLRYSTKCDFAI
jgi:uncharacterized protein YacL (UPF0231 family)